MNNDNINRINENNNKAIPSFLVTGATGNIGSELIKILSRENVHVRAAVHSVSKSDKILSLGIRDIVEMDFDEPSEIQYSIFKEADKIFLLTPNFGTKGVSKILDEAKKAKVKHIIYLSSDSVSLKSLSSKGVEVFIYNEKIVQDSGIKHTILRPTAFMQNFLNNSFTIKTQNKFYLPWGNGKVSFVDTRDIASVIAKILLSDSEKYENKIYSITGLEVLSCNEIAMIFSEILGVNIEYVNVSEETAFNEMKKMGLSNVLIEYILDLSRIIKQDYASYISSSVEEITGKKPNTFKKFVEDYKYAFKQNIVL